MKFLILSWINQVNSRYCKKAGGELLGFCLIAPLIIVFIWTIVGAAQISDANQKLNYCAYNTCRSAVVCDGFETAQNKAQETYELQFGVDNYTTFSYDPCTIELIGTDDTWEKGRYIRCTVRYYVTTLTPFISGIRESSIVMMVENGGV